MSRGMHGRALPLRAGEYTAAVTTVGAGLARLTHRGTALVHPLEPRALPPAYEGKLLAPWPNRVRDGLWTWQGTEHRLPVNEHGSGNALHGLACWLEWQVGNRTPSSVTLHATLAAQPGYPFTLELQAHYTLADDGLTIVVEAQNDGAAPAPVGLGLHPYLTVGDRRIDDLSLEFAAPVMWDVDERGLPVADRQVAGSAYDFATPRLLGATTIDNPFRTGGPWAARLVNEAGHGVELSSDSAWAHLYTGDLIGRHGLAVEPTTCPPDAFNSGDDLAILPRGRTMALRCRIAAIAD